MLSSSQLPYIHRLGPLVFDSRRRLIALQASDILAYENLRHVRQVVIGGEPERWQMTLLRSSGQIKASLLGRESIDALAQEQRWT